MLDEDGRSGFVVEGRRHCAGAGPQLVALFGVVDAREERCLDVSRILLEPTHQVLAMNSGVSSARKM